MKISTKKLEAVLKFAAKKDVRYYLQGVRVVVKAGKCHLIATDGGAMFCGVFALPEDDDMIDCDIIIPIDEVKTAIKMAKKVKAKEFDLTYQMAEGNLMGGWTLGATSFRPIDATYPNVARLVELAHKTAEEDEIPADYNLDYLVAARDAMRLWDSAPKAHYALHQHGMDAASMHAKTGGAFALIMPVRRDENIDTISFHEVP